MSEINKFVILDIETSLPKLEISLHDLMQTFQASSYFSGFRESANVLAARRDKDILFVTKDGRIRIIFRDKDVGQVSQFYEKLNGLLSGINIQLEGSMVSVDTNSIFHIPSAKGAKEAIERFVGDDKVRRLFQAVGNVYGTGITVLSMDSSNGGKSRVVYEIEPLMNDHGKYYLRMRWQRDQIQALGFIQKVEELARKGKDLLNVIEAS